MRILAVPAHYSYGRLDGPIEGGGRGLRQELLELANLGHEIHLIYVYFDGARGIRIEQVHDSGIRAVYVHAKPLPLPVNLPYRMILTLWAFGKTLSHDMPDVIRAYTYRAGLFARPISAIWKIPYVISEHGPLSYRRISVLWSLVARWSFSGAALVVAVSEGHATMLKRYTGAPIRVIPNLVRSDFLSGDLRAPGPREPFRFLSIGRTDPVKGWDILLESFAALKSGGIDARLTLCGGGELSNLEALAAQLGISDRVDFVGPASADSIRSQIESCHCHVLASRAETFGIVSIEALALGRPIIMTPTYAASTIVKEINGLVAAGHSADDLCAIMADMVRHYDDYNADEIRDDCARRFSAQAVCSQILSTYREVLALEDA